jgi:putative ABC transport system permease protein
MLVLLLGSGTGMKNGIWGMLDGFATNSIIIMTDRTGEPYKGFNKGRSWNMRNRDLQSIEDNVQGTDAVSAMIFGDRTEKNIVYGQLSGTYSIKGVFPANFRIETPILRYGRLINEIDTGEKRKVCVIGRDVNKTLFGDEDPCGKYIRVNGIYYQIVGSVDAKSNSVNINGRTAESVFLPFTTMQQTLNQGDILHLLLISGQRGYPIQHIIDDVTDILKTQNEIAPNDPQAIRVMNLAAQFATFEMLFIGIDFLIWLVGMGSLLAGIIGISNIMMVTVRERTREIGVRRALGAKPFNIISQVMSESLVLTALAGLTGLTLGVFILDLVNRMLAAQPPSDNTIFLNPQVSIQTALAATAVLLISGLVAGLIPAWRAMKIKAIDAIREE